MTILGLGPMTNLAQALHRDSTWGGMVGRLILSGGAITAPGDVTPAAEFNIFSDPLAARTVIRSKTTKTLIPLDLSRQVRFSFDLLDHLPAESTRAGKFLRKILPFAFRSQRQVLGIEEIQLNAILPVVAALHPELFETHAHAVDVETEGTIANGMTIADRRNVRDWRVDMDVATNADFTSIRDCVIRSLRHAGNES
ncbi:MAG: nucleoside hydrolase [Pirellulales bacterium]